MLRTLEEKFHRKQCNFNYLEKFMIMIADSLEKEFTNKDTTVNFNGLLKLEMVKDITMNYFQTIPVVLEEFLLQDIVKYLNKYLTENHGHEGYQIKADNANIKCFGNVKSFRMILLAIIKIVSRLGGNKKFKHVITSHIYQEKGVVRINNVIEFGYVDISKVAIDAEELLSHSNLDFYTGVLAQLGQPYGFEVAYTYVNQNISLIAISGEFSIG